MTKAAKNIFGMQFNKTGISDQIADHIKNAIYNGDIVPGDKLPPELELAKQFNVSKVTVREALLKLEAQRLIEKRRGVSGGNYIIEPMLSNIGESIWNCLRFGSLSMGEIVSFRNFLEPEIIKRAVSCHTEEDLAAMRENIEFCESSVKKNKHDKEAQVEFHVLLAKACHNPLISTVMESVIDVFKVITKDFFDPPKIANATDLEYNKQFYECLVNRDSEKAYKIMQEHCEWIKQYLVSDKESG